MSALPIIGPFTFINFFTFSSLDIRLSILTKDALLILFFKSKSHIFDATFTSVCLHNCLALFKFFSCLFVLNICINKQYFFYNSKVYTIKKNKNILIYCIIYKKYIKQCPHKNKSNNMCTIYKINIDKYKRYKQTQFLLF